VLVELITSDELDAVTSSVVSAESTGTSTTGYYSVVTFTTG
jgi:hypothetical protein